MRDHLVAVAVDEQDRHLRPGQRSEVVHGIELGCDGFMVVFEVIRLEQLRHPRGNLATAQSLGLAAGPTLEVANAIVEVDQERLFWMGRRPRHAIEGTPAEPIRAGFAERPWSPTSTS